MCMQFIMASFRSIYAYWYKNRESSVWLISLNLWFFLNIRFFKKITVSTLTYYIEATKTFKIAAINTKRGSFFVTTYYYFLMAALFLLIVSL